MPRKNLIIAKLLHPKAKIAIVETMSVELFEKFLKEHNLNIQSTQEERPTLTAQESARVHGVPSANIVKSLVAKSANEFFVCLCPGDRKLNFESLKKLLRQKSLRMATPNEVKEITGHSIGGVPPFGHQQPLKTILIGGFDRKQPLWAAAGSQDRNFQITLRELERVFKKHYPPRFLITSKVKVKL